MFRENSIPAHIFSREESTASDIFGISVKEAHFDLKTRHATGWRGVHNDSANPLNWSMKIEGSEGVWAIAAENTEIVNKWSIVNYRLYYFPDRDSDEFERMSVAAGLLAHEPEYDVLPHEITLRPDIAEHFYMGNILAGVNSESRHLVLAMISDNIKRIISKNGIFREINGKRDYIVEPGGIDADFDLLKHNLNFFYVLISNFNNINVEEEGETCEFEREGVGSEVDGNGDIHFIKDKNIKSVLLVKSYDKTDLKGFFEAAGLKEWSDFKKEKKYFKVIESKTEESRKINKKSKLPLVMVTGFLGSGKTTLVQNFLDEQLSRDRFIGVIQNEVGDKSIDTLLTGEETVVKEIDEGCVCCTATAGFYKAVKTLAEEYSPELIVLETSGLADPDNLIHEVKDASEFVNLQTIVTVVDGSAVLNENSVYHIFESQVRNADILILNKWDITENREAVMEKILSINPDAELIPASYSKINLSALIDGTHKAKEGNCSCCSHDHKSFKDYGVITKIKNFDREFSKKEIDNILDGIPGGVFRIKGIVDIDSKTYIVQFVNGIYEYSEFSAGSDERFLVFIGNKEDINRIRILQED